MATTRHVLFVWSTQELLPFPMRKARHKATIKARDGKTVAEGTFPIMSGVITSEQPAGESGRTVVTEAVAVVADGLS